VSDVLLSLLLLSMEYLFLAVPKSPMPLPTSTAYSIHSTYSSKYAVQHNSYSTVPTYGTQLLHYSTVPLLPIHPRTPAYATYAFYACPTQHTAAAYLVLYVAHTPYNTAVQCNSYSTWYSTWYLVLY